MVPRSERLGRLGRYIAVVRGGTAGAAARLGRFLLVAGRPLKEPVAWHGPIVMNTREELMDAMRELRNGSFIRQQA